MQTINLGDEIRDFCIITTARCELPDVILDRIYSAAKQGITCGSVYLVEDFDSESMESFIRPWWAVVWKHGDDDTRMFYEQHSVTQILYDYWNHSLNQEMVRSLLRDWAIDDLIEFILDAQSRGAFNDRFTR